MRAFAASVLLVAACSDPPGVTLEVIRTDKAVANVELYLGGGCDACPDAMAPPQMTPRRARIFTVADPAVFSNGGAWNGDRAGFRLESSTGMPERVPIIMAIGYDANGAPIATSTFYGGEIPADRAERWITTLVPSTPIVDPQADADGERVAVWPAQRSGPRCAMVEHGTSIADVVVPADDTDCDGVAAAAECAPFVPNAIAGVPTLATANCVAPVSSVHTGTICMLGGPTCNEQQPTTPTKCEPLDVDYCAPAKLCSLCPQGDFTCIKNALSDTSLGAPVNGAQCTIPLNSDGTQCADDSRRNAELDLGALVQSGETKCTDITVSGLAMPLDFHHAFQWGPATLALRNFNQPCKVDMGWTGTYMRAMGDPILLVKVDLDNGKHVVAPFYVHFADSCLPQMDCRAAPSDVIDSVTQCTDPTMNSTSCSEPSLACNGSVACGARCCGTGEACVDGECRCGDGPHCLDDKACVDVSSASCGTRCAM